MNLLVSYDWLKEYVSLPARRSLGEGGKDTINEFAARMSLSGPAVEKIMPQFSGLDGVVVAEVLKLEPHPKADKLRLATVDIGKPSWDAGRATSDGRRLTLVCGGSNIFVGQKVAVALVGATVRWHGQGEPIVLEAAEIRGVKSEGMICASAEIGLAEAFPSADDHEILDLGKEIPEMDVNNGTPLADVLGGTDDVGMDIEVTANRPDCMGMVGMAREAAVILKRPFRWKEPDLTKSSHVARRNVPGTRDAGRATMSVKIDAKKACPRYIGVRISGVKVGPSPWWIKRRLMSAGVRPINNLVDITNYVMLETGQPMHVFDTGKLKLPLAKGGQGGFPTIHVRFARFGEKMMALDGKTYELDDKILVIADAERPIAVAGVMGGEETGAGANTTDIVLEAACFDPVIVRKGSRKLLLQSDSQLRFEKGLSQMAPAPAMARAIELVKELAGGKVEAMADEQVNKYQPQKYSISTDEVNALIGVEINKKEMVDVLRRLGFQVSLKGKKLTATVPWWRDHDIELGRDLVEEIARVYGYGRIPSVVPMDVAPRQTDAVIQWEDRLKDLAKAAGYTELYSWSFVSEDLLRKAGFDPTPLLKVQNPLSADWLVMRPSLVPAMLQAVADNQEREKDLRLFECSNVYLRKTLKAVASSHVAPSQGGAVGSWDAGRATWDDLPDEVPQFTLAIRDAEDGEPWRKAKGYVEHLFETFGITDVHWKRVSNEDLWHPGRTAMAFKDDLLLAVVGEIAPAIADNFKIKGRVGAAQVNVREFMALAKIGKAYVPPMPYPEAKRDLALVVDHNVDYRDLEIAIEKSDDRILSVQWFDTYKGKGLPDDKKSVAMHLIVGSKDKTLESAEVDGAVNNAILACKEKFGSEVRG